MIDLYTLDFGHSPNVLKVVLTLEELGLEYRFFPVSISKGEQFRPEFLAISPNNKVPVIVDHAPADGGEPFALFESGAILTYLADKAGRLVPPAGDARARAVVEQWVYWQMAGLGPYIGQYTHFAVYAPEQIPYAIERYRREVSRLFGVLDRRLGLVKWLGGDHYSIADIISFCSTHDYATLVDDPEEFPNYLAWHARISERPAYARAYRDRTLAKAGTHNVPQGAWETMFLQSAASVRKAEQEAG